MGSQPTLGPRMMRLIWVVLCSVTLVSGSDRCTIREQEGNVSPLLESLQCHNDYESNVYCEWTGHDDEPLQLWYNTGDKRKLCEPYSPPVPDQPGTVHCTFKDSALSIGVKHTMYFLRNDSNCLSVPRTPVGLSQHLRTRTPEDLSTHDAGDGGRRISWSSPYPSSSPLSKNLTYQLSFRTDRQNSWTTKDVTNTSVTLQKHLFHPGYRCEAKVRARASVSQWSDWSPVVHWRIEQDPGQPPSLNCVLNSETEVMCSWEVSKELAESITYHLQCQHNRTAPSEKCCEPVVSVLSGTLQRYNCLLNVKDPAQMLLKLLPTHNAKSFKVHQHIRPKPPHGVKVKDRKTSWIVEWNKPSTDSKVRLNYQVCFYKTQDQGPCPLNIVSNPLLNIPANGLDPSQGYMVKVRSVVVPGEGPRYEGIPSEWTDPVKWTTHPATWSSVTFLYILIGVFVAAVFLTFYYAFPTCHRKLILWVDSVPSPGKSKILSDIKSATSQYLVQSENTFICKVLDLDTVSTCSSEASLWPNADANKKCLELDEGFWNGDNLPPITDTVSSSDTSSMSFSGPYILCQSKTKSAAAKPEVKVKEDKPSSTSPPSPIGSPLYGEGYVCLPSRTMSRSTQDLVSHCETNKHTPTRDAAEQATVQQCPDAALRPDKANVQADPGQPAISAGPPAYTSGPLSSWPQGGHMQTSGYCVLPQPQ
ncbi:hypothetical protein Q5P01_017615 [Channa striata]|uniref:Fibronectin type-III domain-containing protein n=1 Tax=Channa striata TaxID=64152 RepID=A0AA88MDT2_CHASR|nr:hypothetical protein Q5P01_017615 [Channa striata]